MNIGNILVTAIGSFSANSVVTSLRKIDTTKIFGCDIYPSEWHHVSRKFDKVFKAPLVKNDIEYFEFISTICKKNNISTIIPLTDIEVDFFNNNRDYFRNQGIVVTIGSKNFLQIARNKRLLTEFSKNINSLSSIVTYTIEEINSNVSMPLIAKPIDGRSSEGIYTLNSITDINEKNDNKNYIFQQVIKGKICTVDYVRSDYSGNDFCIPRIEHLRTKNGAGMTVEIFRDNLINNIVSDIGEKLHINGCVNFEFIVNDDGIHLIDINPRFSAGVGFSLLAGYNFIESHLNCFIGKDILPPKRYDNMILEKKMTEVINIILEK